MTRFRRRDGVRLLWHASWPTRKRKQTPRQATTEHARRTTTEWLASITESAPTYSAESAVKIATPGASERKESRWMSDRVKTMASLLSDVEEGDVAVGFGELALLRNPRGRNVGRDRAHRARRPVDQVPVHVRFHVTDAFDVLDKV